MNRMAKKSDFFFQSTSEEIPHIFLQIGGKIAQIFWIPFKITRFCMKRRCYHLILIYATSIV